MCTAISYKTRDHYFGRNLDLDCSYGEEVCVMPRNFPLKFRHAKFPMESRRAENQSGHFAMVGIATVVSAPDKSNAGNDQSGHSNLVNRSNQANTPLFYDAMNEHGLAMAGLNFPGNAYYNKVAEGKDNICQFELLPWILGQCKTVAEARRLLARLNIIDEAFSPDLPTSPLHWMISDAEESIVVESMQDGLHVYDNPVGVLTNNPPFEYQLFNLNNYRTLTTTNGEATFAGEWDQVVAKSTTYSDTSQSTKNQTIFSEYCQGIGAIGLPGDSSSMSRFVRAAFNKENSIAAGDEISSVSQFFHILSSVEMLKGPVRVENSRTMSDPMPKTGYDYTLYTSCMNCGRGLYYYTTYDNRQIRYVDMRKTDLDGSKLTRFKI